MRQSNVIEPKILREGYLILILNLIDCLLYSLCNSVIVMHL